MNRELEINWEITRKCNFNCKHCLIANQSKANEILNFDLFKSFLDSFVSNTKCKIKFTGGEPFVKKDFKKYLDYCTQNDIDVEIITNGFLLTDEIIKFIANNNIALGISFESFNKKTYESIRGQNTFNKVFSNLEKAKKVGIECYVYCSLSAKNIEDITQIIDYCYNQDIKLHFNELTYDGNAKKNRQELEYGGDLKNLVQGSLAKLGLKKLKKLDDHCWASGDVLYINYLGNIFLCTEIGRVCPQLLLGNIKTFPIQEWLKYFNHETLIDYNQHCPYSVWFNNFITYVKNEPCKCCYVGNSSKIKTIDELKHNLKILLKNCGKFCVGCSHPDCLGFIWLLKEEKELMLENGYIDVLEVNQDISFLSVLSDDQKISACLDVMKPKCKLRCANGKCSIQKQKPLACCLYPISLDTLPNGKLYWTLHYDCAFVEDIIKTKNLMKLSLKFFKLLDRLDFKLLNNILNTYKKVDAVTGYPEGPNDVIILKEV